MMNRNIGRLDLLGTFRAIMDERGVVSAADRLGLTQSAVSKHLAQLRDWFADELFVRTSQGMQPTPRALEIRASVDLILAETERLTEGSVATPASFDGSFRISSTDEVLAGLLPDLIPAIAADAPRLQLQATALAPDYAARELENGQTQMVISVNWHAPQQLIQVKLFSDPFVCVMHRNHELASTRLTVRDYARAAHVLVAPLGMPQSLIDGILAQYGETRQVVATVPMFGLLTPALLGTSRIVTVPSRVADRVTLDTDLTVQPLPFVTPAVDYFLMWHPRFSRDHRLIWMRQQIEAVLGMKTTR